MHSKSKDVRFPTTQWTEIENLSCGGTDQQKALIESLFQRYWKPVYAWLRRQGYESGQAEEYTQGFFCDIVLERNLASKAERHKGRFRTFLLKAMKDFISDEYRKAHAQKRTPKQGLARLDDPEAILPAFTKQTRPDDVFTYMWASDFLKEVLTKLEVEYINSSRKAHWLVFKHKIYEPMLNGHDSPSYEALCAQLNIPDAKTAAAMVTTVKRRFRSLLRSIIRSQVESEETIDQEIQELFQVFSNMNA